MSLSVNECWWAQPAAEVNESMGEAARARQQLLTKPPGSLGRLEEIAIRLAALQGRERPQVDKVQITVFAADHGVVAEGVSAFPQEVTGAMIANFAHGGAAISVLARAHGAGLEVVDVGALGSDEPLPGVVRQRVAAGSANIAQTAAMSREELEQALKVGAEALARAEGRGCDLFIAGDMGIGNTTPATAIAAALLGIYEGEALAELVGPGTGLNAEGVTHKQAVIARALAFHRERLTSPFAVLQALGGLEIAAISGAYIAAAQRGIPVLVDGFISSSAALAAVRLNPSVAPWLLLSHASAEPGHRKLVAALGERPLLDLGMRLGEGSGAAVALPLLRLACRLHDEMATFAEAGVADGA